MPNTSAFEAFYPSSSSNGSGEPPCSKSAPRMRTPGTSRANEDRDDDELDSCSCGAVLHRYRRRMRPWQACFVHPGVGSVSNVVAGCPKKMVYGPCGGVQADGSCEMQPAPCTFVEPISWPYPPTAAAPVRAPVVLTDVSAPPADAAMLSRTARLLAPSCDAVLVGDHQDRPDFSPTLLARLLHDAGVVPWVTLACRDRNRVVLEQELRSLRYDGFATVLCVTGDGRAFDVRPEVTQVFDLDGTRLAALAASVGLPVAVAETITARPTGLRPGRLVGKQRAGAGIAVLNIASSVTQVAGFMAAAQQAGLTLPVIASVPVYTDERSAAVLSALPGLELDPLGVRRVLDATDPVSAGIARAVEDAVALQRIVGVEGVNLSGMASAQGPMFAAEVQAEIGRAIKAGVQM